MRTSPRPLSGHEFGLSALLRGNLEVGDEVGTVLRCGQAGIGHLRARHDTLRLFKELEQLLRRPHNAAVLVGLRIGESGNRA